MLKFIAGYGDGAVATHSESLRCWRVRSQARGPFESLDTRRDWWPTQQVVRGGVNGVRAIRSAIVPRIALCTSPASPMSSAVIPQWAKYLTSSSSPCSAWSRNVVIMLCMQTTDMSIDLYWKDDMLRSRHGADGARDVALAEQGRCRPATLPRFELPARPLTWSAPSLSVGKFPTPPGSALLSGSSDDESATPTTWGQSGGVDKLSSAVHAPPRRERPQPIQSRQQFGLSKKPLAWMRRLQRHCSIRPSPKPLRRSRNRRSRQ